MAKRDMEQLETTLGYYGRAVAAARAGQCGESVYHFLAAENMRCANARRFTEDRLGATVRLLDETRDRYLGEMMGDRCRLGRGV